MLVRRLTTKVVTLSCVLILVALGAGNTNAQIDWGRVLDLSPKNTETKPAPRDVQKELELGGQIRNENDRARARSEGRGTDQGAAVNAPNIEMPGVFEQDRRDRSSDYDRPYSSGNQADRRYSAGPQPYRGGNSRRYGTQRYNVNRAEIFVYGQNPNLVPTVDYYRRVAERETVKRFGASRDGDASDAFRHAYASALLSRALGPYAAKAITDAHESYIGNPPHSRHMDLYNNSIGISIGQSYQRRGVSSEKELADMTERAVRGGYLVILRY